MPTREFGDFLVADRTETVLFLPQIKQLLPTLQVLGHFQGEALFKVDFPGRIVGVGCCFDFGVPYDRYTGDVVEVDFMGLAFLVLERGTEIPLAVADGLEIFYFDPVV